MNYKLFQYINQMAGHFPLLDDVMVFATQKALVVFAIALLLMWIFGKENYKYSVVYAAITGVLGLFINFIIGQIYFEPRPFVTHKVHTLIAHAADASFPSDHTTGVFSLALAVFFFHRKLGFGLLLFAILTGFLRIYVGHHYPFDVLGSIIAAIIVSIFIYKIRSLLQPIPRTIINIYNRIPIVPKNIESEKELNH
ncbi:undecaprenyl-diphosphatase [Neobacillus mesonae]|uniref:undecaprenyl-diphosphatase n=1 Tax=Neobacillus mesonae TaxID=1193713 RepID=UPI00203FA9F9|nr:undecaprenyl-diphosphatase [Neobacillus mesonae]MCM3569483.1 undecaprenyl-diphosphatase [Neobacillus mesonae]